MGIQQVKSIQISNRGAQLMRSILTPKRSLQRSVSEKEPQNTLLLPFSSPWLADVRIVSE